MRGLRFVSAASLLACLLLLPTVATAQTTNAAVVGDVADTTEALIPGATVTVTNTFAEAADAEPADVVAATPTFTG